MPVNITEETKGFTEVNRLLGLQHKLMDNLSVPDGHVKWRAMIINSYDFYALPDDMLYTFATIVDASVLRGVELAQKREDE